MTLTIHTAEDDLRQLTMTIEVDEARVQDAMKAKARELGREFNLPGFRPGKAPYEVIVRRVGEEVLRGEAIEDLAQPIFEEALEQEGVEPYARPTLEDIETNPVVLKFLVPLSPKVVLGDYRAFRGEVEDVQVSDEAVEEALEQARVRHQSIETVERPAQAGDVVVLSGSGRFSSPNSEADPQPDADADVDSDSGEEETGDWLFDEERMDILLDDQTLFPDTPFVETLIGMDAGDQKTFSLTFPDPYEHDAEYAGREATFDITLLEVKKRELPPLDDELARKEGKYETLEDLRAGLREELTREAVLELKDKTIDDMIHRLMENVEMVYPPAAIEGVIDEMVDDFKSQLSRSGWQYQDYLNLQGMTEDDLRKDFSENAEDRLRHQLVLRQLILDEKLQVEQADIDRLVEERTARFENEALRDSMRQYYSSGHGFDVISSEVLSDKVYDRIRDVLSGSAPDLDVLADEIDEEE